MLLLYMLYKDKATQTNEFLKHKRYNNTASSETVIIISHEPCQICACMYEIK